MGVLACDRNGCTNVMCDMFVDEMYVCNECAAEFREQVGGEAKPIRELSEAFLKFMRSGKPMHSDNRIITVDEFLERPIKD